jgi:putative lipoic acid-binding regulatory protein
MESIQDLLPELGRILTYDFERFRDLWLTQLDSLVDYTMAFEKLIYVVGLGNPDLEKRVVEVVEEFIASRQKPYEEWKSSGWLAYELGRVVGEELNRTHTKLQTLIPQLVRKIYEEGQSTFLSLSSFFEDEIISDYSRIISYIVEIFSYPDAEAVSEALEVLETFLQGEESREGLKYRLGMIVSKFNDDFKEG